MTDTDMTLVEVDEPSNAEHGGPSDGMECMATMEDITDEDKNYCEYQTAPSGTWRPALYSADVVRRLICTQFADYISGVRKADCEADLKRRLNKGPPIWVEDKHALPVPEPDTHICRVWFAEDGKEYSAKLKGCVEVKAEGCRALHPSAYRACALPDVHNNAQPSRGRLVYGPVGQLTRTASVALFANAAGGGA